MASIVILMQVRFLFNEIQKRLARHRSEALNYVLNILTSLILALHCFATRALHHPIKVPF